MNIDEIIEKLATVRPIFHSEDDLKFAMAWEINENYPNHNIRLEKPIEIKMPYRNKKLKKIVNAPIDIVVIKENGIHIPIELKYKTKKININYDNEDYLLKKHGATTVGRFSFRKDIFRIEKYLENNNIDEGYVIIITNEDKYYQNVEKSTNLDNNYSFHHGAKIKPQDSGWNYTKIDKDKYFIDKNKWIYKKNKKPHWTYLGDYNYELKLKNSYNINWINYSKINDTVFKYCIIKINREQEIIQR